MDTEYNGWKNRETWATALHINNDQALYEIANDYAVTAWTEHAEDGEGRYVTASDCLADTFESWITEDLLTLENISANPFTGKKANEGLWLMINDIGSLYRVNWQEIAESFIDSVIENEKVSA
jgi:hypothetical protein